jgi:ABC-type branched-subunit amino acid transport system ATPase component
MNQTTLLQVTDVGMHFGGIKALDGVTLDVREGEFLGIIGPNGAGKTTLFNVITGTLRASRGSIRFGGHELIGKSPDAVCRMGIARTYQKVRPFPRLTVLENVAVAIVGRTGWRGGRLAAEALARTLLGRVGIEALGDHEAHGLNLFQRKKIELARALGAGGKLLLLDEVMAGLNPAEVEGAIELLRSLKVEFGLTIICIEHLMRIIMTLSDRVVVLDHGSVIAEGLPAAVAADPMVQRAYLGAEHA